MDEKKKVVESATLPVLSYTLDGLLKFLFHLHRKDGLQDNTHTPSLLALERRGGLLHRQKVSCSVRLLLIRSD